MKNPREPQNRIFFYRFVIQPCTEWQHCLLSRQLGWISSYGVGGVGWGGTVVIKTESKTHSFQLFVGFWVTF